MIAELAQAVVDAGAVPLLVLCIQEPEITLKRISASALSDICKHSPELAQTVVDAGAIAHLAQMILNPDAKLKRQVRIGYRDVHSNNFVKCICRWQGLFSVSNSGYDGELRAKIGEGHKRE